MELKIKFLDWSAGIPVAMLNKKTAEKIGVNLKDRISIKTSSKGIVTIVDTIGTLIKKDEIAISSEIKKELDLENNQKVDVNLALPPRALEFIKEKLNGKILSKEKISEIIGGIISNSLSESEIAMFVSAMHQKGMNFTETVFLIESMLKTEKKLKLDGGVIADKHSIGGIAGRTTPIVVSICAVAGLIMPKTSSRAITTPAGTADSMETVAKIEFTSSQIIKLIKKTNACIVWGGGLGMVPADAKLIQVEKMLNIDPEAQLLASIMAKKLSVGSKFLVIQIPYGNTAKVKKRKALRLKRKFENLGRHFKIHLKCILTKNTGPIGRGIGPSLEMMDAIKVLKREDSCYKLEDESIKLTSALLELTHKAKKGEGKELALQILNSGKALKKFLEIVKNQKGSISHLKLAPYKKTLFAKKRGKIIEIDNKKINNLARLAGCPADKFSGVYLNRQVRDSVTKKDEIITIYAESKVRLNQAVKFYNQTQDIFIIE